MSKKPSRNQKVMSEEEKDIIRQNSVKKQENINRDKMTIRQVEAKLFEEEKKNLPQLLDEKINEIVNVLEAELDEMSGLKSARIHQLISRQTYQVNQGFVGYSAKELYIVFNAYKDLVDKINRHHLFVPSIKNFCSFAGFSSITYKNYLQSPDEEKRNVAQMIDDYISDMLLDASKMRKTDASTSIFVAKAEHQMAEAVNPTIIQHTGQVNLDQVFSRINEIKKGNVIDAEFNEKDK